MELKKSRLEKRLSVPKIARILKISSSFYYKIESGIRNPSIRLAKDIADYFGKDMEELFLMNNWMFCLKHLQYYLDLLFPNLSKKEGHIMT